MASERGRLTVLLVVLQVAFVILFGLFVDYDPEARATAEKNNLDLSKGGADPNGNTLKHYYPMFQDIHVMIFIGFGFLMTFLKKYGFSSVGYNFLIGCFAIQWATLLTCFWQIPENGKATINTQSLIGADFAAAAVLISFGAVLGKTNPVQLIIMTLIELVFYNINEHICVQSLIVVDAGGSMFIHTFGAYFGLTVARILYKEETEENPDEGSVYHSDLFAMIGTVFLWLYWPSFNAALVPADGQHRAVLNTYYSLAACCVMAFAVSYAVGEGNRKLDMVHIQNSTLAGGVAIGTCADLMVQPFGAILIGGVAGTISVLGYRFLTPFFNSRRFHDTCGVHNLHGMPGVLAAIAGACAAAAANEGNYGLNLYTVFPARAPLEGAPELALMQTNYSRIEAGLGRSNYVQGGYQLAALGLTLVFGIGGGIITGFILKLPWFNQPSVNTIHDDRVYWRVPDDGQADVEKALNSAKAIPHQYELKKAPSAGEVGEAVNDGNKTSSTLGLVDTENPLTHI